MGVGGNFWDLLKPYARYEGFDFLRNKKVAVDLSYWIVQHETALKSSYVRNPHLRLTFFRTINLFSKFGAFPVFVVDGAPSPLKSQARILRFFRASGIDVSSLPAAEEGVSVERNRLFLKCVEECQELLKLLGMPVLKAKGEAEALCAELNSEGIVDACITADSDAFLYGAKFVIKSIRPNSREPLECYDIADIETGLGMKRRHLIAISLLVGNDHNINGVQGIGVETAARFVKIFDEDEVLNRLHEIGTGVTSPPESNCRSSSGTSTSSDVKVSPKSKPPHCSLCGHPGTKAAHLKIACGYCHESNGMNCSKKPAGFKCCCSSCDMDRIEKERKRNQNWHLRVCKKIALECNFLQNQIIEMYLANQIGDRSELCMSWESPNTEMLIDFLAYYQHWEPSFIRQRMFPMLSTIFLREMASSTREILLYGLYELDSIQRVKIRYGHQFYVVKWKKSAVTTSSITYPISSEESATQLEENVQIDQSSGVLDEPDVPQVHVDDGGCFLLTDENVHLVQDAFPEKVGSFLQQKEAKKRKKKSDFTYSETCEESDSQNAKSVQLSIKDYYRSTKVLDQEKPVEDFARNSGIGVSKEKSKISTPSVPKSVRRRLLFQ